MKRFLFILLILGMPYAGAAQFAGGGGDGSSGSSASVNLCLSFYLGGANDGHASTSASVSLQPSFYLGGANDGHASTSASLSLQPSFYLGGANDGQANSSATVPLSNPIYLGGANDGMSNTAATLVLAPQFYLGGSNEGWASSSGIVLNNLPVTVFELTANWENEFAKIKWKAADETNIRHYQIDRSFDGAHFKVLGLVNAKGSSGRISYSFTDSSAQAYRVTETRFYYRLASIEATGEIQYHGVVLLRSGFTGSPSYIIYPNPASSYLYVRSSIVPAERLWIQVLSVQGVLLFEKQFMYQKEDVPIEKFPSGTYILRITNKASTTESFKFIIAK